MNPRAGELRSRFRFEQRAVNDNGDRGGPWATAAASPTADQGWAAAETALKGGEGVQAQRLQGSQPILIVVRASTETKTIDNSFRAVDARDPARVFDIKTVTLTPDRRWVEILAVQSVGQTNG